MKDIKAIRDNEEMVIGCDYKRPENEEKRDTTERYRRHCSKHTVCASNNKTKEPNKLMDTIREWNGMDASLVRSTQVVGIGSMSSIEMMVKLGCEIISHV